MELQRVTCAWRPFWRILPAMSLCITSGALTQPLAQQKPAYTGLWCDLLGSRPGLLLTLTIIVSTQVPVSNFCLTDCDAENPKVSHDGPFRNLESTFYSFMELSDLGEQVLNEREYVLSSILNLIIPTWIPSTLSLRLARPFKGAGSLT